MGLNIPQKNGCLNRVISPHVRVEELENVAAPAAACYLIEGGNLPPPCSNVWSFEHVPIPLPVLACCRGWPRRLEKNIAAL